jgi:hypothetical protein
VIIVAVADELADQEADEVEDAGSTIAHTATCTITLDVCRKRNCTETDRNTTDTKNRRHNKQSYHHGSPPEQFRLD